jgi:hypothetical protein
MQQDVGLPEFEAFSDPVPVDGQRPADGFLVCVRIERDPTEDFVGMIKEDAPVLRHECFNTNSRLKYLDPGQASPRLTATSLNSSDVAKAG